VLARINRKARIVICGAISQYNNTTAVQGPKNYLSLLVNRARMEGIVVFDYAARYGEAVAEMAGYLKDGRMKSKEDVVQAAWPPSRPRWSSSSTARTSASWCCKSPASKKP
jgi:NADPH-dependent curcumin reductase CurA